MAGDHAGHGAGHGFHVQRFVKNHLDGGVDQFHHDAADELQLGRVGFGQGLREQPGLLLRNGGVRGQPHLLQGGHGAQGPHDPDPAHGLHRGFVGVDDQPLDRVLQAVDTAAEHLQRDPAVHALVLGLHQALPQFGQQRVLVREIAVKRRPREPGALAHQVGRQSLDAHVGQRLRRHFQDALVGLGGALLRRLFLGDQGGLGLADRRHGTKQMWH